jgi:hypothetical protein
MQLALPHIDNVRAPRLEIAFRSGMSRSKDFWGAASAGVAIGVVAAELSTSLRLIGLPRFLRDGGKVFIDSGAFAEVKSGVSPNFPVVLSLYESLVDAADCYGFAMSQVYAVAPDKVGDQAETLLRLARFSDRLKSLIETGCNVIVPIQRGTLPATAMLDRVAKILGTRSFVAGVPANKEALSLYECAQLRHHAFHILGRVQLDDTQASRLHALSGGNPNAAITADANWLRSHLADVCQFNDEERLARVAGNAGRSERLIPARTAAVRRAIEKGRAWGGSPDAVTTAIA